MAISIFEAFSGYGSQSLAMERLREGEESVMECYPYPQKIDGKYRKVWECVDDPNITQNNWLAEEYITKIEELNDENKN